MTFTRRRIQLFITIFALAAAVTHLLFPALKIDAITVTLFIVSIIPWLAPLFKSVELPGGLKMEFQELQQVTVEAKNAGIIQEEPESEQLSPQSQTYAFVDVAVNNPEAALMVLRVEIEKRLRQLAAKYELKSEPGINRMIRRLGEKQILSAEEQSAFRRMLNTLNQAAHGLTYDPRNAEWIMETGPQILAGLDAKLETRGGRFSVGSSAELPHWIDTSFENCGGETTYDQKQCIAKHTALWQQELSNIYDALHAKLSPEQQKYLAGSQSDWKKYIEGEQSLIYSFENLRHRVGTSGEVNIQYNHMSKVKDRTLELEEILNHFVLPLPGAE